MTFIFKWGAIVIICFCITALIGGIIDNYYIQQCRIAGFAAGKTAEDIAHVCK